MGRRLAATVLVAVGATSTACGTASTATSSAPPALRLIDNATVAIGAPAPAGGGPGGIELRTTLPSTPPAPAAVYRLPSATARDAETVARALGVSYRPVTVHGGWAARDGAQILGVRADGSWSYGRDCNPSEPITAESPDVMCAFASAAGPTPVPTPPAPGPGADRTRAWALPVLQRLGVASPATGVSVGAPTSTFTAGSTVGGLVTADRSTSLEFDARGTLVSGSGWVGTPVRGRAYPLVDAARAFAMLRDQPRPMPLLCRPLPGNRRGCAPWPARVVTGARLGLALRHETSRPLLVPAWLFSVQGSPWPLAVVAVDPHYLLQTPTPSSAGTAGSSVRG